CFVLVTMICPIKTFHGRTVMTIATDAGRTKDGRFAPGRSGNPAGRPKGARNRATLFREALREGEAETLIRALVDRALAGDAVALRFCVDRLVAKPRARAVELDLAPGAEADPAAIAAAAIRAMA